MRSKPVFALLTLLCFAGPGCSAFPIRLLESGLPNDAALKESVDWLVANARLVDGWYSEWKAPIPRAEVIRRVTAALEREGALVDQGGAKPEFWLLQALLEHYLYNLDVTSYYRAVVNDLAQAKSRFSYDYRAGWLLAVHYSKSGNPAQSIQEFQSVLLQHPAESVSPYFWLDYAEACYIAHMPVHAQKALEYAAQYFGDDFLKTDALYQDAKASLTEPIAAKPVPVSDAYALMWRGDQSGVLGRLYGLWARARTHWQVRADADGSSGFVSFKLGPLRNSSGTDITYTIVVLSQVAGSDSFDGYVQKMLDPKYQLQTSSRLRTMPGSVVYEWQSPEMYPKIGGGHGFYVFLRRPEPQIRGYAIEGPSVPAGGQSGYVQLKPQPTRYPGEIYYAVLLDTCNDIFDQSVSEFQWFLDGLILE